MATKVKRKAKPVSPLVQPTGAMTGCLYCSLFPHCELSQKYEEVYNGKMDAVRAKALPEGHTVKSHAITEPWTHCEVLFLSDSPTSGDDTVGRPLGSKAGTVVRKTLNHVFDGKPPIVGMACLVRCRTVRGAKPNPTHVVRCSPQLEREIKARKPKVIVANGNLSLKYLTGQSGITALNGVVLECTRPGLSHIPVIASVSPGQVMVRTDLIDQFYDAFMVLRSVLEDTYEERAGVGEYEVLTTVSSVKKVLKQLVIEGQGEDGLPVAYDTETGDLSPFATEHPQLLCLSFSNREGNGWTVPFDHSESPWGGRRDTVSRTRIKKLLQTFFRSKIPKLAQNGKFDDNHIRKALGVVPTNVSDTMLLHLLLDETKGTHGLKNLAYLYTGMGGYDRPLELYKDRHDEANPDKGGSYANIPGELLFNYAAGDTDVTVRVYNAMLKQLAAEKSPKLVSLYANLMPRLSSVLADMEYNGAQISPEAVECLRTRYTAKVSDIRAHIGTFQEVQRLEGEQEEEFNPNSPTQLSKILFEYYGEVPHALTKSGTERMRIRYIAANKAWKAARKGLKPQYTALVAKAAKNQEWSLFSTKEDVLQEFARNGNPFVSGVLDYRESTKCLSTYIDPLTYKLDCNFRIHGRYLIDGTVTGRLASRGPNLQNQPNTDGGIVKMAFISRFGENGLLAQLDYSQAELRVAACRYNEPEMIRAYMEGQDLHLLTAIRLAYPEKTAANAAAFFGLLSETERKGWRTRAKRVNFGILYGGGPGALVTTLQKDGVFLTFDEAAQLIESYFLVRPMLKAGIDAASEVALNLGYLESGSGRRRRLPEVRADDPKVVARALRQAVNFPVQADASELTLMAMVLIHEEMKRRGYKSLIVMTVHDSIILDLHVDEAHEVLLLAREIMQNITLRAAEILPEYDLTWLSVPMVADVELGYSWGSLVGVDIDEWDVDTIWEQMDNSYEKQWKKLEQTNGCAA